ncbi:MAG: DNA gyrase C-terminal beta-propeller domain-containing protein, partial [Enterovibrio sp.]
VSERNGNVVGAVQVSCGDEFMMITNGGTLVRTRVQEVCQVGRNTQGVRLIRTSEGEDVVGLQRIDEPNDEESLCDPKYADQDALPDDMNAGSDDELQSDDAQEDEQE